MQLSDIHIWRYAYNPARLFSKRAVGIVSLLAGRARRFRLERLEAVVERVVGLRPDHVLITGDLTTTALPAEFQQARAALAELLADPDRATVIPGNHDRYTSGSVRRRTFEATFGPFAPGPYPWLRQIGESTAVLGLDPTRPHLSAKGLLPPAQLAKARELIADPENRPRRLIVACHYPVAAPPTYERELFKKRMRNDVDVIAWLAGIGPHLYCCGHVHAAWAFTPPALPAQLCLNSGAPLLRDRTGLRPPGFLEITLDGPAVRVAHHAWTLGLEWKVTPLADAPHFFDPGVPAEVVPDAGAERL